MGKYEQTNYFNCACLLSSSTDMGDPASRYQSWAALDFDQDFAVNVGNANGTIWTYTTPDFSMSKTRMAGASLSKWPAAIMISGLVADGTMSYDDPVNKHLKYWATDEKDVRSKVTLRDLLTFTSGYIRDSNILCREG